MAVWLPATNKFYLPPKPITRILSTEEYVQRTSIFYHAATERLLTVGHPYHQIVKSVNGEDTVTVPKVSPNQYRVFRVLLPDPNNFAFGDTGIFNPEKERLVWALRGLEVSRGQPLGVGITGHPLLNKFADVENNFQYANGVAKEDERMNVGFDPKQSQLIMVGCKPQSGEHWQKGTPCSPSDIPAGACPPLELVDTIIEDGDMTDIGFGALDFKQLNGNLSEVPLDIAQSVCKYPDFVKMAEDPFGDTLFFYARREQLYARHALLRDGEMAEKIPEGLFMESDGQTHKPMSTDNYFITPSGSLVSSEAQLFNRPYWLQKAQGHNNGILWGNEMFLTLLDNTRGTVLNISVSKDGSAVAQYKPDKFNEYVRHVEEFQLSFILQLCKVQLTPENLAFIHTMNPDIVEAWHLSVNPPPNAVIEDHYRYINSLATRCPDANPPHEKPDPYEGKKFWVVDLKDRMTEQLDQTPLGRKFLIQSGSYISPTRTSVVAGRTVLKRRRRSTSKAPKRRRT